MITPSRLFITTATLRRADSTVDESGPTRAYSTVGALRCRLGLMRGQETQLYGSERQVKTGRLYYGPDEDVRIGDTVELDGRVYRILSVIDPNLAGVYKISDVESIE